MSTDAPPAPILYVTDLTYARYDPADLFDLAYLLRSPEHDLRAIGLSGADPADDADRVLDALIVRNGSAAAAAEPARHRGAAGLLEALRAAPEPLSVVIVGGYSAVAEALAADRALFREKVARLFLVGGHANDYTPPAAGASGDGPPYRELLPIDPRLRARNPERFAAGGDPRLSVSAADAAAFAALLQSGEAVIWLPRDICLWRYAAPGILEDGGPVCEFLLRELFYANLTAAGPSAADRYDAADAPALLSTLPALLLAVQPDPFVWMRLFRAATASVSADPATGRITAIDLTSDTPNLYAVIAIDSQALGKLLTARLRDRPLAG